MDDRTKNRLISALDLGEPMVLLDAQDTADNLPMLERVALGVSSTAMGMGVGGLVASAFMNAVLPMAVLGGGSLMIGAVHAFLSIKRVNRAHQDKEYKAAYDFDHRKRLGQILESGDFEVKTGEKASVLGTSATLEREDISAAVRTALKRGKEDKILKEIAKGVFGGLVLMSAICSRVPEIAEPVKSYLSTVLPESFPTLKP